ncbi:ABC-type amino acid transport substrate-binding protein [Pseudomonas sp. NFACC19-2]|uniref:ABC-type amino acid transport substrate-binding protein n=1 Tax=Ectopseudomonas toyotomiensis TaxID=554344 RepID=A0A1I5RHV4_9GAMM|nr:MULTISPECIES: amino acid ABC transporter substrate-binding protein [Pseudomonas]PIA74517.1 amino acid ABC transporter substrate-binding protein [Pseudomonas toyotomiensis]SFP57907.1 ABC-type amino acid transport substrate-binding protein [Pseudomonas toyotomiensis]SFW44682.1 ABC-type amino acid transport substrate-binding protein [Pseudomonas sp. NFACC19-2]
MRALAFCLLCSLSLLHVPAAVALQEVRVGGYHFPPYLDKPESPYPQGLVPELLRALNAAQQQYRFVLVPTSATRRYRDLESGRFDLMFFESSRWGWQGTSYLALGLDIDDAEVYVAAAEPGRGQDYFEDFNDKRMALYNGYHYGFASFDADPDYLARTFNALLTYSHDSNLRMLLARRVDIAVVTRSYLELFLDRHPEMLPELLVSDRLDQLYHHQVLLRPKGPLSPAEVAELLNRLQTSGELAKLLGRYRLTLGNKVSVQ